MEPVEIFIIDDHPIFINGIKNTFSKNTDNIFVGGWAKTVAEAREKLKTSMAHIIFLDLKLPGESGVDYCIELKRDHKDKKVIALTGESDVDVLYNVWMNDADAIVTKMSGKKLLISTIETVLKGERIIGSNVPPFFDHYGRSHNKPMLTKREHQVMNLLASGYYRKEVAEKLDISIDTVSKHCSNVFNKFGVDSLQSFLSKHSKIRG